MSVLNGGLVAWIRDGRKVMNAPATRVPVVYALAGPGQRGGPRTAVRAAAERQTAILLDVRTAEEYLGEPKKPRTGTRARRARWWPWGQGVDFQGGFVRRPEDRILNTLRQAGVTDRQTPVIAPIAAAGTAPRMPT